MSSWIAFYQQIQKFNGIEVNIPVPGAVYLFNNINPEFCEKYNLNPVEGKILFNPDKTFTVNEELYEIDNYIESDNEFTISYKKNHGGIMITGNLIFKKK